MAVPRVQHTATRLLNGQVLVVGGGTTATWGGIPDAAVSAEVFDSGSGRFFQAGDLAFPRAEHTATLMPDGSVLIIGGFGSESTGALSVERFDPLTGLFSVVGQINVARRLHTASLLQDGRVLVVGGFGSARTSAELFDPDTGESTLVTEHLTPRYIHSAHVNQGGTVVIVGGTGGFEEVVPVQLYLPASENFVGRATLPSARSRFGSILLDDGRVLIAGGQRGGASGYLQDSWVYYP